MVIVLVLLYRLNKATSPCSDYIGGCANISLHFFVLIVLCICFMPMTFTCLLNREGFFSRKDKTGCSQATSNISDTSSNGDIDFNTNEQTGASSSHMVPTVHAEHSEPNNRRNDGLGISGGQNCLEETTCENLDRQDSTANLEGAHLQCLQIESVDPQSSSGVGVERRAGTGQNVDVMPIEDTASERMQQSLQTEDIDHSTMQEFSEAYNVQSRLVDISNGENDSANHNNHVEEDIADYVNWNESAALEGEQLEEVIENEGSDWHQSNNEWRNSTEEGGDDNQLSGTAIQWPENSFGNEDGENSRLQEGPEVWQEDGGFQEAVENWLGGPSDLESAPVGRIHGFYFPDDDNVYSVELRELLNRYVNMSGGFLHLSF